MDEQSHNLDDVVPVDMLEDRLFDDLRAQVESMIAWARTDAALAMQNAPLEERALAEGFEATRLLTEAHRWCGRPANNAALTSSTPTPEPG